MIGGKLKLKSLSKLGSKGSKLMSSTKKGLLNRSKQLKNSFMDSGIGLKNSFMSSGRGLRSSLRNSMEQIGMGTYVARLYALLNMKNVVALCAVVVLALMGVFYYKYKNMFTFRMFTPSYVINIDYYNSEFAGKLTDLILEFEYLRLNQFEYDIEQDIYLPILNDDMAVLFAEVHTILEKNGLKVDMNSMIDTNDKLVKFFKKRFTQYRKAVPEEEVLDDIQLIFDTMEEVIAMKTDLNTYAETESILNYIDFQNLDIQAFNENKLFKDFSEFFDVSLYERYLKVRKNYSNKNVEYVDNALLDSSFMELVSKKDKSADKYVQTITNSMLKAGTTVFGTTPSSQSGEFESIILELADMYKGTDFVGMSTTCYAKFEEFLYTTTVPRNGVLVSAFEPIVQNELLNKFHRVMDLTNLIMNEAVINNAMDFTLHYMLDEDPQKSEKLTNYANIFVTLNEYAIYQQNHLERLDRYNRSRWPNLPALEKIYQTKFDTTKRIFIEENIRDQWKEFVRGKMPPLFAPIVHSIDRLFDIGNLSKAII